VLDIPAGLPNTACGVIYITFEVTRDLFIGQDDLAGNLGGQSKGLNLTVTGNSLQHSVHSIIQNALNTTGPAAPLQCRSGSMGHLVGTRAKLRGQFLNSQLWGPNSSLFSTNNNSAPGTAGQTFDAVNRLIYPRGNGNNPQTNDANPNRNYNDKVGGISSVMGRQGSFWSDGTEEPVPMVTDMMADYMQR
jgi:hypothetical protein